MKNAFVGRKFAVQEPMGHADFLRNGGRPTVRCLAGVIAGGPVVGVATAPVRFVLDVQLSVALGAALQCAERQCVGQGVQQL